MSANRWLATGNFFSSYKEEQRIFSTTLDRSIFCVFLLVLFLWPLFFDIGNKYFLVIDSILIAIIAVLGLNLLTGFAGLISIGHAAFVGVGAYTVASISQILGPGHAVLIYWWPFVILLSGGTGALVGAFVDYPRFA